MMFMWRHIGVNFICRKLLTIKIISLVFIYFICKKFEMLDGLPREYDVIVVGTGIKILFSLK